MTFEVRKGDTTLSSVWTNSVRNAFRKQAEWAKLQEARTAAAIREKQPIFSYPKRYETDP